MAKIERQEVIEKITKGLRLATGLEKTPVEIEDKIKVVFVCNEDNLFLSRNASKTSAGSGAIHTNSTTEKTILKGFTVSLCQKVAGVGVTPQAYITLVDVRGSTQQLGLIELPTNETGNEAVAISGLNLELKKGSAVYITNGGDANTGAHATIFIEETQDN